MELTREVRDRRVAIARDVLLQMGRTDVPLNVAAGHGYVTGAIDFELGRYDQIQPHIDAIQKSCTVCQRGAVLLSKARLFDGVRGDHVLSFFSDNHLASGPADINDALSDTFDRLTLDRLEAVFEATAGVIDNDNFDEDDENAVDAAASFGRSIPDPAERVRICMQSLIDHDGELVLDEAELAPIATEASPL